MTPAEREFSEWWREHGTNFESSLIGVARYAFLAGRAAGLRAALSEHKRPLVAHQVADSVMRSWDESAVPEGGLS